MKRIQPFLWFNDNAEQAVDFYVSVFPNAKRGKVIPAPEGHPNAGSVLTVNFTIGDTEFVALNGGPQFQFTHAVSFVVPCENQAELDTMWARLTADGGKEVQCGWVTDKFGLSWQVVPANIGELLKGKDAEGGKRAFAAMMEMVKLDIDTLRRAGGLA